MTVFLPTNNGITWERQVSQRTFCNFPSQANSLITPHSTCLCEPIAYHCEFLHLDDLHTNDSSAASPPLIFVQPSISFPVLHIPKLSSSSPDPFTSHITRYFPSSFGRNSHLSNILAMKLPKSVHFTIFI